MLLALLQKIRKYLYKSSLTILSNPGNILHAPESEYSAIGLFNLSKIGMKLKNLSLK